MATPAQIDEQVKLERQAIAQGLEKLRKDTEQLEQKSYASATIYGVASVDTMLPLVIKEIEDTVHRIKERKNGVHFKEIAQYLSDIEPLAAAAIACKITFDYVFSRDDDGNLLANVTEAIGKGIENECHMRHYEQEAPGLLNVLKENYWHRSCGTEQKLVIIRTLMNRYNVKPWDNWGRVNRIKLGTWLLDCVIKATGWFQRVTIQKGKKTPSVVIPTPEFLKIKDEVMANAELFSPEAWPMLIEPNDWSEFKPGGYLLNEVMKGHQMVRRSNHPRIQGEQIYAYLNRIQKVGYCINPFIADVAETLYEAGITVGKFIPVWHEEAPPKPVDIEDDQVRLEYRRAKAEYHNRLNDNAKKSVRTRKTMEAVRRYRYRDQFFLPWSLDYRGRAYPIPAYLTPQDTDFGKSLLKFAKEAHVNSSAEEWLSFQVATTYGLDKKTMKERLDWTNNNHELITRVATNPLDNLHEWEAADEPWQFLAACEEYYHVVINCDRNYTSLPIATDATCSGMQILAGLARDASTARYVNVLPSDTPQDAYRAVVDEAMDDIPAEWKEHIDRSVAKRLVMTIPYNAKFRSNAGYVRQALKEKGLEPSTDDVTIITTALREACFRLFPGPKAVMDWINNEVTAAIRRGATELEWVTPSGFVAHQKFMKKETVRLDLKLMGRVRVNIATGDSDKVDVNHHKNATSPNLIHSLDASLLQLAVKRFDAPIALIHDSVLCRATDMSLLSTIVRETYMHLFAENDYLRDFASQIGAETEPPIIGDLEPESVIESTYFFC
jgi:DNA-directed RNA polymerase|tara:strand:+ start:1507 stop:3843 length:2337 start_codon:yes stop_codon:yes gene_type:complete